MKSKCSEAWEKRKMSRTKTIENKTRGQRYEN